MRIITHLTALLLISISSHAQYSEERNATIKWAPTALVTGNINLQAEYNFGGRHSLTASIGLPANARHTLTYQGNDAVFNMKSTTFLAGYRTYLSQKHLSGLYLEPYFKYTHHASEGVGSGMLDYRNVVFDFHNEYNAMGLGAQLGAQFLISDRVVIDLFFLGPEFSYARNNLKAIEVTGTGPWNTREAVQAQVEVINFINQIPFIRNRTTVMVDKDNRTVTAQFNGPLPGFRAGLSLGIAL